MYVVVRLSNVAGEPTKYMSTKRSASTSSQALIVDDLRAIVKRARRADIASKQNDRRKPREEDGKIREKARRALEAFDAAFRDAFYAHLRDVASDVRKYIVHEDDTITVSVKYTLATSHGLGEYPLGVVIVDGDEGRSLSGISGEVDAFLPLEDNRVFAEFAAALVEREHFDAIERASDTLSSFYVSFVVTWTVDCSSSSDDDDD